MTSFLICDTGQHADAYVNGLPIGRFITGQFSREKKLLPNGSLVDFKFQQLPEPRPASAKVLKLRLRAIIDSIPDDL